MKLSHHDIIEDEIYAKAYDAAKKAFEKKYNKLKTAADSFIQSYDSSFGEPEKWPEYFKLKTLTAKTN